MTHYEKHIDEWFYLIRGNHIEHCRDQEMLLDNVVEPVLNRPDVYVDEKRIARGLSLQKYFPFKLVPWETFQFAIMAGVFLRDPQAPYDDIYFDTFWNMIGRGAGKNGFIDFVAFWMISPIHGVKGYNVDLIANGEDQAATSIKDVGEFITDPVEGRFKRNLEANFKVYTEKVIGKKMSAEFRLNTTSVKNKDSKRTGCVIYDEKHQYEDTRNMNTLRSGKGKVKWARELTFTTDGHIRGAVLDNEKSQMEVILREYNPKNRTFPNWFRIENEDEWSDIHKIVKANPSILYPSFLSLRKTIEAEIQEMPFKPDYYPEFLAKRCNFPISDPEKAVAEWNDIIQTKKEPEFEIRDGMAAVGGVDFTKTNDFCGCVLLFREGKKIHTIHHTFICAKSKDLPNIHAPIREWVAAGYCTIIDDVEIAPEIPAAWFEGYMYKYNIVMIGIDSYRYTWLNKAFKAFGYDAFPENKEDKRVYLVRPSDEAQVAPHISSALINHEISGWDPMMCWYCNNTKRIIDKKGNTSYGKIEPRLRKTDGFKGFVAGMACIDFLPETNSFPDINLNLAVFDGV